LSSVNGYREDDEGGGILNAHNVCDANLDAVTQLMSHGLPRCHGRKKEWEMMMGGDKDRRR
jgi:hypothetical protein